MPRVGRRLLASLLLAGLACGEAGTTAEPDAGAAGTTAAPDAGAVAETRASAPAGVSSPVYAGRAACVACHPEQAAAFRGSHHDLAMAAPDSGSVLGDFDDARHDGAGGTARFHRAGAGFRVEAAGADGRRADREVVWTFGVEPLQQLLLAAPGGRLQAFGVAWDARAAEAGGQRWFALFPGAEPGDPLHWTGYEQTANHQCLECHTTAYVKGYDVARGAYDSRWSEEDVSCEACHGPASKHVERARAGAREPGGLVALPVAGRWELAEGAPIARRVGAPGPPARREVDLCARCHARRERFSDRDRPDRPFLDAHRPALLEPHLYHADGQPRDEVYVWGSFLQSRMAAAGVTCSDCHDPHSLQLRVQGNALCGSCHGPAVYDVADHHQHEPGSEAALCVTCHMPQTTFMGVDARREHAFRVPRPDRSEALAAPDACTACHTDRTAAWAAGAIRSWFGPERPPGWRFPEALARARAVELDAATALVDLAEDVTEPAIARATAVRELRGFLDPGTATTVLRAAGDPDPLVRMVAAETAAGLPPDLRRPGLTPLLADPVRAVRMAAATSLADLPPASWSDADRTRLDDALAESRAAARRNADRPEARLALSLLHLRRGDLDAARAEAEAARAMDPGLVPAAVNLADVLRLQGRDDAGEAVLRDALARRPESPELHHALGLLWVRQGRLDAAGTALERAAALAGDGRFSYAAGLLQMERGDADRAFGTLEKALAARPGDRDLLVALVTLYADRGQREAALRYARRLAQAAPGDPSAAALRAALESREPPAP